MISYQLGGSSGVYHVQQMKFPAGEVGVQLTCADAAQVDGNGVTYGAIKATLKTSDDIMTLLLTVDALKRKYKGIKLAGYIPYMPYARQDRVCNEGESLSITVMASLINSCNFYLVGLVDPHSDVTPALINNSDCMTQEKIFSGIKTDWRNTYIVAPDAGAYKKAGKFASFVGAAGVIVCNKDRDLATGKITGIKCSEDVTGLDLAVLDDIGDGMGTFIMLAPYLQTAKSKILCITHGIFSKGVETVAAQYDHVYTTNSYHGDAMNTGSLRHDKLTWIEV